GGCPGTSRSPSRGPRSASSAGWCGAWLQPRRNARPISIPPATCFLIVHRLVLVARAQYPPSAAGRGHAASLRRGQKTQGYRALSGRRLVRKSQTLSVIIGFRGTSLECSPISFIPGAPGAPASRHSQLSSHRSAKAALIFAIQRSMRPLLLAIPRRQVRHGSCGDSGEEVFMQSLVRSVATWLLLGTVIAFALVGCRAGFAPGPPERGWAWGGPGWGWGANFSYGQGR